MTTTMLSIDETDALILKAGLAHGAIEDAEVTDETVSYFFEDGTIGTVCRSTGAVSFTEANQ
jgi:hypothetical protein